MCVCVCLGNQFHCWSQLPAISWSHPGILSRSIEQPSDVLWLPALSFPHCRTSLPRQALWLTHTPRRMCRRGGSRTISLGVRYHNQIDSIRFFFSCCCGENKWDQDMAGGRLKSWPSRLTIRLDPSSFVLKSDKWLHLQTCWRFY